MVITKGKLAFLICFLVFVLAIMNTSSDSNFYTTTNQMQISLRGKKLRAVTGHFPPYVSILRNSSGHITGYSNHMYHLLLYLSQKLKFTYRIFPARENTFGVKNIGIWNGVIGAVANFEADIGLVPATVSLERYEAIEFSEFVGGDNTGILIKYPAANISFTSAFDVFSLTVWIGGIISGIAISAISVVLSYLKNHCVKHSIVFDISYSNCSSIIRFIGNHFQCHQPSQKLLAATWCFVTFVFVNTYNSTLTSYMSVTYQKPEIINSFRDLATATPSYKATVLIGSIQDIDLRVMMEV
ncbi:hypothetical protein DAPPUDRAFT_319679 [Daphnia pulex]|uniref:Uncharacterized protein n=1 Tax=Daphnia pulex TaxID=6669 RepID=E9GMH0_DAPPU|nr:hypothetical protein DAPPUDRAFT_319679 [Daphnia pulex]|eukprot:EFX79391.1 hypothetical protein DAPPUDRAFT_319679 [Daphnia pulex]